jgi:hypothetical protein
MGTRERLPLRAPETPEYASRFQRLLVAVQWAGAIELRARSAEVAHRDNPSSQACSLGLPGFLRCIFGGSNGVWDANKHYQWPLQQYIGWQYS